MKWLFITVFMVLSNVLMAQNKIDSLKNLVSQTEGTEKIDALNNLSFYSWNNSPNNGIEYGQQALDLSIEANYRNGEASALQNIGVNYWAKGNLNKANSYFFSSLRILEETGDKVGLKSCLNNIGIIYSTSKRYEKSIENFLKAREIAREINDIASEVNHNNNIGESYMGMGEFGMALDYFNQNIEIRKENDVNEIISSSLSNKGFCLIEIGKPSEAIPFFREALSLELKLLNVHQASLSANGLGYVYMKQGRNANALKYLKQAEELAIEAQALEPLRAVQKNLADYYVATNNLGKALDYKNKFIATNDSIFNAKSAKQIEEIRIEFESEKKEKENELLRKDNQIQTLEIEKQINLRDSFIGISILVVLLILIVLNRYRVKRKANILLSHKNEIINKQKRELQESNNKLLAQYDELKLLNATKDKFFMVVSHDLKGPFNSILGFARLLSKEYDSSGNKDKVEFIKEINKSSRSAFNLLENLLVWAQTQTGKIVLSNKVHNVKEIVEESIDPYRFYAVKKNISIDIKVPDDIMLLIDKNTSISFIGNLVNNAIKFTPEEGKIVVNVEDQQNSVEITVADNGVGMTPETIDKLFKVGESISTKGTLNEKGTGLGLIICKEFVEKNGGTISVESELGKGSTFIINLPKKYIE